MLISFCYECYRKINLKNDDTTTTTIYRCGSGCGARFCCRECFQSFIATRLRQHNNEACKPASNLRQLLETTRAALNRRKKFNRLQSQTLTLEAASLERRLLVEQQCAKNLSKQDKLMIRLLICEATWWLIDNDNNNDDDNHQQNDSYCRALLNCALSQRQIALLDSALLFGRTALSISKKYYENR